MLPNEEDVKTYMASHIPPGLYDKKISSILGLTG